MFPSSLFTREGWHSGGCFPLEETLFTIKFYLQVKEMMHLIPNHCFSPEGLYYSEVVRVCAPRALRRAYITLFLSVVS